MMITLHSSPVDREMNKPFEAVTLMTPVFTGDGGMTRTLALLLPPTTSVESIPSFRGDKRTTTNAQNCSAFFFLFSFILFLSL